jgi:branched-chain amino acid transport system substrate-binding protein
VENNRRIRAAARTLPALLAASLLLGGCGMGRDTPGERIHRAEKGTGDILIGAAWPWKARQDLLYSQGMELALEQVNAEGGVSGRRLKIVRQDDNESVNDGRMVAQSFAQNPDIVAVIGHLQSYVTVPAAAIYDLAGIVMVAPASTDPELTRRQYRHVFRGTFTDVAVGRDMARLAAEQGHRRVGVYYVRNEYGRGLANAFEEEADSRQLVVVGRESYDPAGDVTSSDVERVVREWQQLQLDAIFLAGEVPHAPRFIVEARRLGLTVPILAGDAVGTPQLIDMGGKAVEGMVVATAFHPGDTRPEVARFVQAFKQRFGKQPDVAAALGYDAVWVLARAMRQAGSPTPARVAEALRGTRGWPGVTGTFTFDDRGELVDKPVVRAVVRGGRFEFFGGSPRGELAALEP